MEFSIPLNKFEKRELVKKLLEEGKVYREICQLAHVSPRDIKPIAKEYEGKKRLETKKVEQKNQIKKPPSLSTKAFILYREGKKIDEAKVLLNIPYKKAMIFWAQYLKSIRMFESFEFYKEFSYDIPALLTIVTFIKQNNVDINDIRKILNSALDVNTLNQMISNLQNEITRLQRIKQNNMRIPPIVPLPKYYNW